MTFPRPATHLLVLCAIVLCLCTACGSGSSAGQDTFSNPVITKYENTSVCFYKGTYYYVTNTDKGLTIFASDDPTRLTEAAPHVAVRNKEDHGLLHTWRPQIARLQDKWYIYFSADDGNTDDHQIYVFENTAASPLEGEFAFKGKVSTDPDNNWAIHSYAFEYDGQLYMLWSGWQSRRVYAETQCIYIARMENPWTLASERVKISEPEYEWERQWVNPDGYKTAYPVYVNESPFFFGNDRTDKLYIYYSASAMWTPYYCIGELSAPKGGNLLDPKSWRKNSRPVFSMNASEWPGKSDGTSSPEGVYSPGYPYIIPSPDSTEYYLLYMARNKAEKPYEPYTRSVRMQKIGFSPEGAPILGSPEPLGKTMKKPSGIDK